MSTMLKSAAMTVLSKFLQTFLYKYLLDVDVEGVAMPSLIDVDGHSGWGVRLCNVRLREGVELMTLPGKRKLKRTRRKMKKQKQPKTKTKNSSSPMSNQPTHDSIGNHTSSNTEHHTAIDPSNIRSYAETSLQIMKEIPLKNAPSAFPETIPEERTDSNISSRVPSPTLVCRTSAPSIVAACFSKQIKTTDSDDEEFYVPHDTPPTQQTQPQPQTQPTDHFIQEHQQQQQQQQQIITITTTSENDFEDQLDTHSDHLSFDQTKDLIINTLPNPSRPGRLVRARKQKESQEDKEVRMINAVQESATEQQIDSNLSSRVPSPTLACRTSASSLVVGCLSRGASYSRVDDDDDDNDDDEDNGEDIIVEKSPITRHRRNQSDDQDILVQENVYFDTKNLDFQNEDLLKQQMQDLSQDMRVETISEQDFVVEATTRLERQKSSMTVEDETKGQQGEDENVEDIFEEEEEEYFVEEDMILQLGTGGRIGTLDVRLVGKDLHVIVEDAFLIVEACSKPEEADDASRSTAATADTTKDDASRAKKQKDKRKNSQSTPKKLDNIPTTPGERIMENCPLARALNAIPHLLLRDVRIQLVVKDGKSDPDEENPVGIDPNDTVVELGIEMLSVTSGEDILAHIRGEHNDDVETKPTLLKQTQTSSKSRPSLKSLQDNDENEYLVKRIRTGKGPDGGISVRIYPPGRQKFFASLPSTRHSWAVCSYTNSSQFNLCRLAGIDLRARIFLGKKRELAIKNNEYAWFGDEYDEYTMDSMLFGVDYINTDPPPLPPLKQEERVRSEKRKRDPKLAAEDYKTDINGIQSSEVSSSFHKVGRGLTPSLCEKDHLPCEYCPYCWENPAQPNSYSEHPLDSSTPLPGTVLELTINEAVEVNLDRLTLEVINGLLNMFVEKKEKEVDKVAKNKTHERLEGEVQDSSKNASPSLREKMKSWAFRRKKEKKETLVSAFPSYMQPETIEVVGVHIAKIIFRIHVVRADGLYDTAMAFRYWEACLSCVTLDLQKHASKEKNFIDARADVGYVEMNDFGGIEKKRLLSLGLPYPDVKDSDSVSQSSSNMNERREEFSNRPPWPSTAAALLLIPPPVETAEYASRERHSIQVRFISLDEGDDSDLSNITLNARIGILNVDLPSSIPDVIDGIISETQTSILGDHIDNNDLPSSEEVHDGFMVTSSDSNFLVNYVVRINGGTFCWSPLAKVRLPLTKMGGEVSSDQGVFFETILNHVKLEYGKKTLLSQIEPSLPIVEVSKLPESVRLRILLFLKDLGPLENALGIPREANSFMRCRSVNKALVRLGSREASKFKRKVSRHDSHFGAHAHRRQEILNEMMKLDDHELEALWIARQRSSS